MQRSRRRGLFPAAVHCATLVCRNACWKVNEMPRNAFAPLAVAALIAIVVSVDLLFFRNRFWERLMVNVGIVLVFGAFYLRFAVRP